MTKTVLICDDECHVVWALEFKFKKAGFNVICASDGEEAWEAILAHQPDIVITDCLMPVLDGYQLAQRIRADERTRDLPIIFLTATATKRETRDAAKKFQVAHVEAKPFSPKGILALTNRAMTDPPTCGAL